jgi:Ca2+-transporting ATPase
VLLGPFIGVSLPLTVTQMLWVNLIMDTFAAIALATEPPHEGVKDDCPRDPDAFIITPAMIQNIAVTGVVFLVVLLTYLLQIGSDGTIDRNELSRFFTFFVMLQFWNLFNARCWGLKQSAFQGLWQNRGFVAIATAIIFGQMAIVEWGGSLFRTVPLSLADWIIIILSSSTVLWCGEIWRLLGRNRKSVRLVKN